MEIGIESLIFVLGVALVVIAKVTTSASRAAKRNHRQTRGERDKRRTSPAHPVQSKRPTRPRRDSTPTPAGARHVQAKFRDLYGRAWVIDGDTITIQKTQIRLFGIDAPELNHPFGQKAKWELVRLCKGQTVVAEITDIDTYGRIVAKCVLADGRDLSAEMVKAGLAIDWPRFSGGIYGALEVPDARRKMWLADARQKGRMHVWEQFEARQRFQAGGFRSGLS